MSSIYYELEDHIEKIVSEYPEEVFGDITLTKEQIKRNYHWIYDRYEKGSLLQYQLSCELPKEKYECWLNWAHENHFVHDDYEVRKIKERLWRSHSYL